MAISVQQSVVAAEEGSPRGVAAALRWAAGFLGSFGKPVKPSEIVFFNSQLSLMLEVGTPLSRALAAIATQSQNVRFQRVLQAVLRDIEEGRQLSEAMGRHPRVFPGVVTSMVKAGETGGFLKKTLDRIVEMQEKRQAFVTQLRSTMTYPAVLCVLGLGVVVFIIVAVLPRFLGFFEGKEEILPATTRAMMFLSRSLTAHWWAYLLGALGAALGVRLWLMSVPGRRQVEWFLLHVPALSRLTNKTYTCDLLRTLGNLMESRVPILEALRMTRSTVRNHYFRRLVGEILDHVEQGGQFSRPFAKTPHVLESVKQMVAVGEEVGNLPKVMLRLAEYYDEEVGRELKTLSSLMEPLALIVLGGVVGLVVSSVILPLFRLAHAVH